jgi:hypothetical protein
MAGDSQRSLRVVVFGGSDARPGEPLWRAAADLGAAVAARGWTLVNGGYGGTMLASAQAARAAGGRTIGVGCTIFKSEPNEHLSETIWTDNLHDRLRTLIELGDACVCLPGSTGTLVELAMVWELVNKGLIDRRPLLCWGEFWRPVVGVFAENRVWDPRLPKTGGLPTSCGDLLTFVGSAAEAVDAILAQR